MSWLDDFKSVTADLTGAVKSVSTDVADTRVALKVINAPAVEQARVAYAVKTAQQNGKAAGSVGGASLWSADGVNRMLTGEGGAGGVLLLAGAALALFFLLKR